jgi:hypothetical protein
MTGIFPGLLLFQGIASDGKPFFSRKIINVRQAYPLPDLFPCICSE